MSNILVMGGSRFIGKTLLSKLENDEDIVVVLNRGTIPDEEYLPKNATHYKVDRNDKQQLEKILESKEFDLVFDISAITRQHVENLVEIIKNNVKRFIHVSSGSVYSMEEDDILELPITEDHPFTAINENTHPYLRDKTQAELLLFEYHEKDNFPVTIVRPTYVYGPNNYVYREAYFFDRISRDRPILLPEKGEASFDLIHVDDLIDLMLVLSKADDKIVLGQAFNGSSGNYLTTLMYAKIVAKLLNKNLNPKFYELDNLKDLEFKQPIYPYIPKGIISFSNKKSLTQLGFKPKFNYQTGLKNAYDWWIKESQTEPEWELEDLLIEYLKLTEDPNQSTEKIEEIKSKIINLNKK